jgi:hypothetical protein
MPANKTREGRIRQLLAMREREAAIAERHKGTTVGWGLYHGRAAAALIEKIDAELAELKETKQMNSEPRPGWVLVTTKTITAGSRLYPRGGRRARI